MVGSYRFLEKDSVVDMLQAYVDDTGALAGLSMRNDTSDKCVSFALPSCSTKFFRRSVPLALLDQFFSGSRSHPFGCHEACRTARADTSQRENGETGRLPPRPPEGTRDGWFR